MPDSVTLFGTNCPGSNRMETASTSGRELEEKSMRTTIALLALLIPSFSIAAEVVLRDGSSLTRAGNDVIDKSLGAENRLFDTRYFVKEEDSLYFESRGFELHKYDQESNYYIDVNSSPVYKQCTKAAYSGMLDLSSIVFAGALLNGIGVKEDLKTCRINFYADMVDIGHEMEQDGRLDNLYFLHSGSYKSITKLRKQVTGIDNRLSKFEAFVEYFQAENKKLEDSDFDLDASLVEALDEVIEGSDKDVLIAEAVAEIRAQLKQLDDIERIEKLQGKIVLTAEATQSLAGILFRSNPEKLAKSRAVINTVQQATNTALALVGDPDPFNKAMLGLKLFGSVNGTLSLFGVNSESPEQVILNQISSLRSDITDLAKKMNRRFDVIEQMLAMLDDKITNRFDSVEMKLQDIERILSDMGERDDVNSGLLRESLRHLLAVDYKLALRTCLSGFGSRSISRDKFVSCLSSILEFTENVSAQPIMSGSGFVPKSAFSPYAIESYDALPRSLKFGYLLKTVELVGAGQALTGYEREPVSIDDWYLGVHSYLSLARSFHKINNLPTDVGFDAFLTAERANITKMKSDGAQLQEAVSFVRESGARLLLRRYNAEARSLIEQISEDVILLVSRTDLGLVSEELAQHSCGYHYMAHQSVIRAHCDAAAISYLRDNKQRYQIASRSGRRTSSPSDSHDVARWWTNNAGGGIFTSRTTEQGRANSAIRTLKSLDPFSYMSVNVGRSDAVKQLQGRFLKHEVCAAYYPEMKTEILKSYQTLVADEKYGNGFDRLEFLKRLLVDAVSAYRVSEDAGQVEEFVRMVGALPSSPDDFSMNDASVTEKDNLSGSLCISTGALNEDFGQLLLDLFRQLKEIPNSSVALVDSALRDLSLLRE